MQKKLSLNILESEKYDWYSIRFDLNFILRCVSIVTTDIPRIRHAFSI